MELPTAAQVQALLSVTFDTDVIDAAIEDAVLMLGDCAELYDDARNKAIVKYLAAHLLAVSPAGQRGSIKSESVDGVSYSFGGASVSTGLNGSAQGQTAMQLDTEGCMGAVKTAVKMVKL